MRVTVDLSSMDFDFDDADQEAIDRIVEAATDRIRRRVRFDIRRVAAEAALDAAREVSEELGQ